MATFNWIITCGCNNPTKYHCNTCGENLCSTCKQTHLQNTNTKHHSVVEYTKRLTPGSLSSLLCHDHDGKECICWCQTCEKAACIDCVTKSHRGHQFTELETVLQERRVSLQEELKYLESNDLKEWRGLMIEARKATSDFLGQVDWMEKELEERAKEFHHRVEEIKENYKKELNELKTSNLTILHRQEKRVSVGLEKVKQQAKECEDQLRSSDMESLLEHKSFTHDKKDPLPTISCATPPVLSPSQIDTKALTEMFGQLTVPKTKQTAKSTKSQVLGQPYQASSRDTQSRGATNRTKPQTQLIPKPSVLSEFRTKTDRTSVICVGSGLAWVRTYWKVIQLVDRHGAVKDTIHTDFDFDDMVLSPQGDILLTDHDNKCIQSIASNKRKVKTLFKLQREPCGLCCLHSGDIAVTFPGEHRVVIYGASGKVIQELDKELFKSPHSVAQSKVNSDLYISDRGKVVVLDKDYRVRYEYAGQGDGEYDFDPRGVCTDNAGRILIPDYENARVDILDRDGRFLQYLVTKKQGLKNPSWIDVDSEGKAWVGENIWPTGYVKVVKYL